VISKTLQALSKGQNALLESPTGFHFCLPQSTADELVGTGKTLALLTSTLSWQKKENAKPSELDPLCSTLLFSDIPEVQKPKHQIYFCSRTHSQLQQVSPINFVSNLNPMSGDLRIEIVP
jgi:Rad3-related DNA helicase